MNWPWQCNQTFIKSLLSDYFQGTLSERFKELIRDHLVDCPSCMREHLKLKHEAERTAFQAEVRNYHNYCALEARDKFRIVR